MCVRAYLCVHKQYSIRITHAPLTGELRVVALGRVPRPGDEASRRRRLAVVGRRAVLGRVGRHWGRGEVRDVVVIGRRGRVGGRRHPHCLATPATPTPAAVGVVVGGGGGGCDERWRHRRVDRRALVHVVR